MKTRTAKQQKLRPGTRCSLAPKGEGAPRVLVEIVDADHDHERRWSSGSGYERTTLTYGRKHITDPSKMRAHVKIADDNTTWKHDAVAINRLRLIEGTGTRKDEKRWEMETKRAAVENSRARLVDTAAILSHASGSKVAFTPSRRRDGTGGKVTLTVEQAEALLAHLPKSLVATALLTA
jgi:hypothetical protein